MGHTHRVPEPTTVRYGEHGDQRMQRWDPAGSPVGSALLFHGGYWRQRYALDLMEPMAEHLAATGWRVWNVEYRRVEQPRSPGRPPWDATAADVLAALAVVEAAPSPGPVVVIGHSAGGQLALWAAAVSSIPRAAVALAPVADLEEADRRSLSDGAVRDLLGGDRATVPDRYADASPLARLPIGVPQLVVHGLADVDVPPDLATSYVDAARAAGDEVDLHDPPNVDHFHIIDPDHPVWRRIDAWLSRHTTP